MRPAIDDAAFERALRFTLNWECRGLADELLLSEGRSGHPGALVDDPVDPGGRTAYGITQAAYDTYRGARREPARDVWTITAEEVVAIYRSRYWAKLACLLPPRFAIAAFDTSVLHGTDYAIRRLQDALGLRPDGVIGPITSAAIARLGAAGAEGPALQAFLQARDDRYEGLVATTRKLKRFYDGWERRCDDLCDTLGVPRTTDPPVRVAS